MGIVGGVGEHGLLKLVGLCMTGNPSLVMPQVFQGTRGSDEEEYCQYDLVQWKDHMGDKNTTKNIGLEKKVTKNQNKKVEEKSKTKQQSCQIVSQTAK